MAAESISSSSVFSSNDDPTLTYRPISTMAVISLLLGIASIGAFFTHVLWIVPPIALLLAGYTSTWLERARNEYNGQIIARVGVFLAFVSLLGAPTIFYTKQFILARESKVYADQFLDFILENKVKSAFGLTVSPLLQVSSDNDIEKILDRAGRENYLAYLSSPAVVNLTGKGLKSQVTYNGSWYTGTEQGVDRVIHYYMVTVDGNEGQKPIVWTVPIQMLGATGKEWPGRRWQMEAANVSPYIPPEERKKQT